MCVMRVVDLYAGLGGFSAGAIAAGACVELVVDNDHVPLKLLAANVPGARVKLATLGAGGDDIDFLPPPAPDLHVHASSPCTELATVRTTATPDGIASGLATLQWSIDLVLERGDCSWSLENVSTVQTRALLQEYVECHPERVAYATLDARDFGAAQMRVRLIAGPPALIRALKEMPTARHVSVRDAFAKRELTVPSTHVKNQTRARGGGPSTRSCEEQAFTVCASHALTWCDRDGKSVRVMTSTESAVLMGFPCEWRLPHGSRVSQRAVGNALCVEMSKAIMHAAMRLCARSDTPSPDTSVSAKRHADTPPKSTYNTAEEIHRILKKLRRMERVMVSVREPLMERPEDRDAQLSANGRASADSHSDLRGRHSNEANE